MGWYNAKYHVNKIRVASIIMDVKRTPRLPEPGVRVSIVLIAVAIGLVGTIQFSWFSKSATMEIEGSYRSLNATVLQTMSREFERYGSLVDELRMLPEGKGISKEELLTFLEREFGHYGPDGSQPRLISMVGVTTGDESSSTSVLQTDGTWQEIPSPFALPIPEASLRSLSEGKSVVCGNPGGERQFILAPAGEAFKGGLAVIELDTEGFFSMYTKPAVASVLPGATIVWSKGSETDRVWTIRGDQSNIQKYEQKTGRKPDPVSATPTKRSFNPLRVMLRANTAMDRTFTIVVPATMDSFMMRGLEWFESWTPGRGDEASYRTLQGGSGPDPKAAIIMRTARITLSAHSSQGSVERRLALNWLFSVLLLLGLGLAFSQAIIRKHILSAAQRREREFVASITHELRTPVTAIRSAADNMRRGIVGAERTVPYGEMIFSQALRLGSMIEEVLLFSQVESGTAVPPVLVDINAAQLLIELQAPLDEIARTEGIAIVWDFGSLPASFKSDLDSLRLILSNLIANALYHAYSQSPKGEVRVLGKSSLSGSISFFIEDDGRGISRKEAIRVFDPFYRDETSRALHEKGSGLGLFIARRKAALLGGSLKLESPYERIDGTKRPGCRLTLTIPYRAAAHV